MARSNQEHSLAALPLELLTLIALSSDSTTSILNLSATNKSIFDGLFQPQTFKRLISGRRYMADQSDYWDDTLIAERAGKDAMLWARFAKADEQATHTMSRANEGHTTEPTHVYDWIGELVVADRDHWRSMFDQTNTKSDNSLNSIYNAIIAPLFGSDEGRPPPFMYSEIIATLYRIERGQKPEEPLHSRSHGLLPAVKAFASASTTSDTMFLWVLREMITSLEKAIDMRRHVWPFTNHAIHPDIPLPKIDLMPLRRLGSFPAYDIPVPFANACHLNDTQSWAVWYKHHTQALLSSIFQGVWQGYYSDWNEMSDPPMTNMRFTPENEAQRVDALQGATMAFTAQDCTDGIGPFSITGKIWTDSATGETKITAKKQYLRHSWSWILRMTPIGLVGFWGNYMDDQNVRETHGTVWLWKKEWCA